MTWSQGGASQRRRALTEPRSRTEGLTIVILIFAISSLFVAQQSVLWRDPGQVQGIDFKRAAGLQGRPRPPFQFVEERLSGNTHKVIVLDSAGVRWRVKGGSESRAESFATRLVGALGYYVAPTWFVASGTIHGVGKLVKAAKFIRTDGSFSNASFERQDPELKSLPESWAWNRNPFLGTHQLNGLKVLVMLLADWDNKDERDRQIGSNTGVFRRGAGAAGQHIYGVRDWGQALGGWGPRLTPNTWNCERYTVQTRTFVRGHKGNYVLFDFTGQHTDDFKNDITAEDVRWLMRYLGRISDAQLRNGLQASGATPKEVACFAGQLRRRIRQLTQSVSPPPA